MPVRRDEHGNRYVEAEVEVPGSPEEVWDAIATADGISSWFMPTTTEHDAEGRPTRMITSFGPGMDVVNVVTGWNPPDTFTPEGFAEPEPVRGGVNSERSWAFNPAVSPDGRQMVFTRLDPVDPQATGFGELYLSRLDDAGEWSEAVNLGRPVNTPMDEYHPSFSADGTTLYFVRRDVSAETPNGKLYRITARILVR
jgi:hypothetical protein